MSNLILLCASPDLILAGVGVSPVSGMWVFSRSEVLDLCHSLVWLSPPCFVNYFGVVFSDRLVDVGPCFLEVSRG